jgi:hypothetical protein
MGTLPLTVGIDEGRDQLTLKAKDNNGREAMVAIPSQDIPKLMAMLSHCQHALALAHAGQPVSLPIAREAIFKTAGQYGVGAFEGATQFFTGIDDTQGMVAFVVWSSEQRLTSYRMSPDMARKMSDALSRAAEQVGPPQRPS